MIVQQADGICIQNDVAQHAAIGAVRVGDETSADKRVAAEYGDGEDAADGAVCGDNGILPVGKGTTQTVCREVFVFAEFLKAEYIDVLLLHVLGNLFAGVAGNFVSEVMDVIGGYGEVTAVLPCRFGAGAVAGTSWGEPKRITAVRYSQLKKKAVSVTNAHFLRANAQQRATIRQDTSSTGTASPSKGMMVECSGW